MRIALFRRLSVAGLAAVLTSIVGAQSTWDICRPADPMADLHSDDFSITGVATNMISAVVGVAGTTTYGSNNGFCFAPNGITANARGRFAFGAGLPFQAFELGTMQTTFDDGMVYTFGAPFSPGGAWSYSTISSDDTSSLFGSAGFSLVFNGASDRYVFIETTQNNVRVRLRIDAIGDAARMQWDLTNTSTANLRIGMNFGSTVALLLGTESRGTAVGAPNVGGPVYAFAPGRKSLKVDERFIRTADPAGFPNTVNFMWDQQNAYGMRIDNTLSEATTDTSGPTESLTNADEFVIGKNLFLLGGLNGGDVDTMPDQLIPDTRFDGSTAFIQKWNQTVVAPNATRRIIQYVRSTWSDAVYGRPYTVVVDTPKVINLNAADPTQFEQAQYNIRVYVDNVRGFSQIDQELPLQDVRVTLSLPAGASTVGSNVRVINRIDARTMGFVDFPVTIDPTASGELVYQAIVEPTPGPRRIVTGNIKVVSQPRLFVGREANLVTSPWTFQNPVWDDILGLQVDTDFQAFTWDPQQRGYIISTGPERGRGAFLISRQDRGFITLQGSPSAPTDQQPQPDGSGGAPLISLKSGWNLIGNPYPTPFDLGQIVGSTGANPNQSFTFNQLVAQGIVSGSLATWDNATQTYRFVQGATGRVEPQKGYWVYVFTQQDLVLRFPPIFEPFVRAQNDASATWTQSDQQWRLQLVARTPQAADDQNFVGVAKNADQSVKTRMMEPPIAPIKGAVSMAILQDINGTPSRLAQSLIEKSARQEFRVQVDSNDAGPVTISWPNLSTIPKNVRVRLVDTATNESRDLRKNSGYTFQAEARSTREFKVQIEPGVASRAVIGNVVASRDGRSSGRNAPIIVNYTLASDATTSVRILSGSGREVYTVTRGRAEKAGNNSVTWNLRDNANRSVAPGTYRVEIVAEGEDGERVRKIVPIIVTR